MIVNTPINANVASIVETFSAALTIVSPDVQIEDWLHDFCGCDLHIEMIGICDRALVLASLGTDIANPELCERIVSARDGFHAASYLEQWGCGEMNERWAAHDAQTKA